MDYTELRVGCKYTATGKASGYWTVAVLRLRESMSTEIVKEYEHKLERPEPLMDLLKEQIRAGKWQPDNIIYPLLTGGID